MAESPDGKKCIYTLIGLSIAINYNAEFYDNFAKRTRGLSFFSGLKPDKCAGVLRPA